MKIEELRDMSKRMVVEYYNRYVHNIEPDMADIKITTDNVKILEEELISDGRVHLTLQVSIDIWIEYHVEYDPMSEKRISSYVTLS